MDSSRANTPSRVENKPDTVRLRWCTTTSVWTKPLFCRRSSEISGDDREVANALARVVAKARRYQRVCKFNAVADVRHDWGIEKLEIAVVPATIGGNLLFLSLSGSSPAVAESPY